MNREKIKKEFQHKYREWWIKFSDKALEYIKHHELEFALEKQNNKKVI